MKTKNIFVSFVCCLVLQANAQTMTNTIVNDGNAWATLNSFWGFADSVVLYKSTSYHFFDGDTVFNGKTYRKVFEYNDEQHLQRSFSGLIREENKKTYFVNRFPDNNTVETVLYDFTMEAGDTLMMIQQAFSNFFDTMYFPVEKCDTIIFNGEPRKRMMLKIHYSYVDTVVETIGSFSGLLSPLNYGSTGFRELLCYYQNDELLYKNPKYSECYYNNRPTSIIPTIEKNNFSIFPNPAKDILFIISENEPISQVEIFDIFGRKVYNKQFYDHNQCEVVMSNLQKGIYIVKITTNKGQVSVSKILKK
jgi:hypothetical protein